MSRIRVVLPILVLALMPAGCSTPGQLVSSADIDAALQRFEPEALQGHMRTLADDRMEGRAAGSEGYRRAAGYVAREFEALGLRPAGEKDGYLQPVPLRSSTVVAGQSSVRLAGAGGSRTLVLFDDYVLSGAYDMPTSEVSAPLVYVGYGVSAPELGYDDYAGVDVRDKVVVLFRGAPASLPHNERAYYSSRAVKSQAAVDRGAVGMIAMMTPAAQARAPWARIVRHAKMPSMRWEEDDGAPHDAFPELKLAAMLSAAGKEALFAGAAHSIDEIHAAVEESRPMSFDLSSRVEARTVSRQRSLSSPNVAAVLPGRDAGLADEFVVLTAHLDHVGIGDPFDGDGIHNGAYDNASGIAIMLEIARVLSTMEKSPRRSILFLAVTAEEKGLLGADYFTHHPTVLPASLVADVNLDMVLMLHPLHDIIAFGAEHSSLDRPVRQAAQRVGLGLSPDPVPEEVLFVRSDQYPFVRLGVPSLFVIAGWTTGDPAQTPGALENDWLRDIYHSPRDDMSQEFDFEAGTRFAQVNFLIAWSIANDQARPVWNEGDFFGDQFGAARNAAIHRTAGSD